MNIVILGGGITGLTAAEKLSKKFKNKIVVIEKEPFTGGLAATFKQDGLVVDFGSHRLHKAVSRKMISYIEKKIAQKLLKRLRKGKLYFRGNFIQYPPTALNLIKAISVPEALGFAASYIHSRFIPAHSSKQNFESTMIRRFGKKAYEALIKDYALKLWGIPPQDLSPVGTQKRIIISRLESLKDGLLNKKDYYFYPMKGIGEIASKTEEAITYNGGRLIKNARVTGIELFGNTVKTVTMSSQRSVSEKIPVSILISTIPIDELSDMAFGNNSTPELSWRAIRLVYILLDKKLERENETFYFPTASLIIGRVSNIEKYSPHLNPDIKGSLLTIEIPCLKGDAIWKKSENEILEDCLKDMEKVKIMPNGARVLKYFSIKLEKVYPLFKIGWKDNFLKIYEKLNTVENLFSIGRKGLFLHCNIDHCILQGIGIAEFIQKNNLQKKIWDKKSSTYLNFYARN